MSDRPSRVLRFGKFSKAAFLGIAFSGVLSASAALAKDFKIALVTSTTGAFEAYAKQAQMGFQLGLEYATKGTMKINGENVAVVQMDDQLKPGVARSLIEQAFRDDGVDVAVGSTSSATTLAMMPVAEELKKPLVVDVAGADSITGDKGNPYVVRTGRAVSQEAVAAAALVAKKGASIAIIAQDYAFGHESAQVFKAVAEKMGASVVDEEFLPLNTTDFTGAVERTTKALKDRSGDKVIWVNWVGSSPVGKINAMDPKRYGIELATTAAPLSGLSAFRGVTGLKGVTPYYSTFIDTPENKWLVAEAKRRFDVQPDVGTAFAFDAALAIVEAATKAGSADLEKMLAELRGMSFEGASGQLTINKQNNQALHDFYGVEYVTDASGQVTPKLIHTFDGKELSDQAKAAMAK